MREIDTAGSARFLSPPPPLTCELDMRGTLLRQWLFPGRFSVDGNNHDNCFLKKDPATPPQQIINKVFRVAISGGGVPGVRKKALIVRQSLEISICDKCETILLLTLFGLEA